MKLRSLVLSLFCVVCLFALAACGNDDKSNTTDQPAPTTQSSTPSTPSTTTTPTTTPEDTTTDPTTGPTDTEVQPDDSDADSSTSDKADYIKDINALQTEFASEAGKLNLANPDNAKDFKSSLDKVVVLVDKLADDARGVTPPAEIRATHQKLIKTLTDYNKVLKADKGDLVAKSQSKVQAAARRIATASTDFSRDFSEVVGEINTKLRG